MKLDSEQQREMLLDCLSNVFVQGTVKGVNEYIEKIGVLGMAVANAPIESREKEGEAGKG